MTAQASAPLHAAVANPWLRYGARLADILLFAFLLDRTPLWSVWLPGALGDAASNPILTGTLAAALWIPWEALFLRFAGRTPGKWMYGCAVRRIDGRRLTLDHCLLRSLLVFAGGLGFGIRPVAAACFLYQYGRVVRGHTTLWDRLCRTEVRHEHPGVTRVALAAVVTLVLIWLLAEGRVPSISEGVLIAGRTSGI